MQTKTVQIPLNPNIILLKFACSTALRTCLGEDMATAAMAEEEAQAEAIRNLRLCNQICFVCLISEIVCGNGLEM